MDFNFLALASDAPISRSMSWTMGHAYAYLSLFPVHFWVVFLEPRVTKNDVMQHHVETAHRYKKQVTLYSLSHHSTSFLLVLSPQYQIKGMRESSPKAIKLNPQVYVFEPPSNVGSKSTSSDPA